MFLHPHINCCSFAWMLKLKSTGIICVLRCINSHRCVIVTLVSQVVTKLAKSHGISSAGHPDLNIAHPDLNIGASKHTFLVFISLSSGPRCVLGALRLDIHLWSDSFFLHPPPPPQEDIYTKTEGFCRSPLPWAILFNYAADETAGT